MKKIHILSIGGTIASVSPDPLSGTNYRTILNAEEVLATLGRDKVSSIAELTTEDIIRLDSASLTVEHWLTLARRTEEVLKSCDAVIITHGTDTMEETAFFLNLCVNSSKPVILTGAMRPASATGFEGALNLYNSITAAASGKLEDCGVVICMNGTLIAYSAAAKIAKAVAIFFVFISDSPWFRGNLITLNTRKHIPPGGISVEYYNT